jgi:hypothetical protein
VLSLRDREFLRETDARIDDQDVVNTRFENTHGDFSHCYVRRVKKYQQQQFDCPRATGLYAPDSR